MNFFQTRRKQNKSPNRPGFTASETWETFFKAQYARKHQVEQNKRADKCNLSNLSTRPALAMIFRDASLSVREAPPPEDDRDELIGKQAAPISLLCASQQPDRDGSAPVRQPADVSLSLCPLVLTCPLSPPPSSVSTAWWRTRRTFLITTSVCGVWETSTALRPSPCSAGRGTGPSWSGTAASRAATPAPWCKTRLFCLFTCSVLALSDPPVSVSPSASTGR